MLPDHPSQPQLLNQLPAVPTNKKRSARIIAFILVITIVFISGYAAGNYQHPTSTDTALAQQLTNAEVANNVKITDKNVDFNLLWKVWNQVKSEYVNQPVSDATLFYGAVTGIAEATGDPYTEFFKPDLAAEFSPNIDGTVDGIGAEIGVKDKQLVVIAPLKDSPAEKAGIKSGDAIVKIDGKDPSNFTLEEAVNTIRGPKGTTVTLTIYRDGATNFKTFTVTRDEIKIPNVTYKLQTVNGKKVAVITLSHFSDNAHTEFIGIAHQAVLDAPDAIVLDLRDNPGGILDESVAIASEFIPTGVIVQEKDSNGTVKTHSSTGTGTLANISKVAVLVNAGSASASEILAGALQDYHKATIIGTTSYGKGSVQNYQTFPDGSSLKVTVAKWLTPLGKTIDKTGIKPDITVQYTAADAKAGKDPQFDRAIQEITK